MKKFILILLGIILTTTVAFAAKDNYKNLPAGIYTCPEEGIPCTIHKQKDGKFVFDENCKEKITDSFSKYAPMIKRKQCQYVPDPNQYYSCEFADATCSVLITPNSARVGCTRKDKDKDKKISRVQRLAFDQKVLQFAKEGKCRNLYPEPPAEEPKKD